MLLLCSFLPPFSIIPRFSRCWTRHLLRSELARKMVWYSFPCQKVHNVQDARGVGKRAPAQLNWPALFPGFAMTGAFVSFLSEIGGHEEGSETDFLQRGLLIGPLADSARGAGLEDIAHSAYPRHPDRRRVFHGPIRPQARTHVPSTSTPVTPTHKAPSGRHRFRNSWVSIFCFRQQHQNEWEKEAAFSVLLTIDSATAESLCGQFFCSRHTKCLVQEVMIPVEQNEGFWMLCGVVCSARTRFWHC